MVMLGNAALLLWWDIVPDGDADFHEWHTREHFPERLGVPGFLRGRRYAAELGAPRYFTLYELESLAVTTSPALAERLDHPTAWTRRVMPTVRNFYRTPSQVTVSLGRGMGGTLATVRLVPRPSRENELRRWLATTALPKLLEQPQMGGAHLCEAVPEVNQVQAEERRRRGWPVGDQDTVAHWVVLAEGGEPEAVADALQRLLGPTELERQQAASGAILGIYRLLYELDRSAP